MSETASLAPKSRILDELGVTSLLVPDLVNRALAANDRIKYYLTLLATARGHADHPGASSSELRGERQAAGVDDGGLDGVVAGARREADGSYHIPEASRLVRLLCEGVVEMIAPLRAEMQPGEHAEPGTAPAIEEYTARLARLEEQATAAVSGERVAPHAVAALTHAVRERGDSLHLLVMDLHRELNRLQAAFAQETIQGARVYAIEEGDRELIAAFMAGVNDTAPLKFEHPGLGTTATRAGDTLVIQNDIGTTDAHVLVLHVRGLVATLTYTDLHIQRAQFFQEQLSRFKVRWEDTRSRRAQGLDESDTYYLCLGGFAAEDRADLSRYLRFLGSRIVFLIDWNRARKRLGNFLRKKDAIAVLAWAAENDHGHRAFLQLGGEQLVHEAIEHARAPIRYGERLDAVIGREATIDFLRFVLRITAEHLLAGRSERLVRDEVKAEFLSYFHSLQQGLLGLALDHATTIAELAHAVHEDLGTGGERRSIDRAAHTARRAAEWERRADELLGRARSLARRSPDAERYAGMIGEADDAADDLEEVAFLLTLLPRGEWAEDQLLPLADLSRLLVDAAREFVKCVEAAAHIHRGAARDDVQDFLEAVDRIVTIEHDADAAERRAVTVLVAAAVTPGAHFLFADIARSLESASDGLTRAALMLRDHMLGEVLPG